MKKIVLLFFGIIFFLAIFFELNYTNGSSKMSNSSVETVKPTIDVETYETRGAILDKYKNESISIIDIDKDGISDLIVKDGTAEADYMFYVYKGIDTDKYTYIDSLGAGHSTLFNELNTTYLTIQYAHMDSEVVKHISIIDGKLIEETITNRVLSPGEPYQVFEGQLTFQ